MEEGSGPEKELYLRERDWRRESEERESGIVPWNEFWPRSRRTSWVSLETSGVRVPE